MLEFLHLTLLPEKLSSVICSLISYSPGLTDLGGEGTQGFKGHFRAHSLPRSTRLFPMRWWARLLPVPWACGVYDRTKSKCGCDKSSGVAPGCFWPKSGYWPVFCKRHRSWLHWVSQTPTWIPQLPERHIWPRMAAKLLLLVGGYKLGFSDLAILLTSFCLESFKYSDLKLKWFVRIYPELEGNEW